MFDWVFFEEQSTLSKVCLLFRLFISVYHLTSVGNGLNIPGKLDGKFYGVSETVPSNTVCRKIEKNDQNLQHAEEYSVNVSLHAAFVAAYKRSLRTRAAEKKNIHKSSREVMNCK